MKRLFAVLFVLLIAPALALGQTGGIKDANLSPDLYYDVHDGISARNATGSAITVNQLVYICGWLDFATASVPTSAAVKRPKVCLADADVAGGRAMFLAEREVANGENGWFIKTKRVTSVNTNGSTIGNPIYLSSTAGGWTLTAPTNPATQQVVGRVVAVSSTVGIVQFELKDESLGGISSVDLADGGISSADIGLKVRAGTNLAAGDLVYLSSYNATDGFVAALADADVAGGRAQYVATGTIASGSTGTVVKAASITVGAGGSAGDPCYLTVTGTTGNTVSLSAPAANNAIIQIVGRLSASGTCKVDLLGLPTVSVGTNEINDDAVTNAKLANITQGSIKVGGAANAPTDLDANNSGYILVGDGTDVVSVDVGGDVDLATNGSVTIQPKAVEPTMQGLTCTNNSGGDYAAGDFVYFNSHTGTVLNCALADADVAGAGAQYVVTAACTNGSVCVVARSATITGVNTDAAGAVGDPIYLTVTGTTTNTWSVTAPTGSDDRVQIVGRVTIDGVAGAFLADIQSLPMSKIATNEIQNLSVTNALVANNTIHQTKLGTRDRQFHFADYPTHMLNTGVAFTSGGAGTTSTFVFPEGSLDLYFEEAAAAVPTFEPTADGIDFGLDDNDDDGMQLRPHQVGTLAGFTGRTDAFYVKATFKVEDASGVDPGCLGLMTPQAAADIDALAGLDGYGGAGEEVVAICIGSGAGVDPAVMHTYSKTGGAASVDTTLTTSTWADGATHTLEIDVAASGAVTYKFDGAAPVEAVALTLTADTFYPFIVHDSSGNVNNNFYISLFEWGLQ